MTMWIKEKVTPKQLADLKRCDKIELRLETIDGNCSEVVECYTKRYVNDILLS
jgi:hypothetical protein